MGRDGLLAPGKVLMGMVILTPLRTTCLNQLALRDCHLTRYTLWWERSLYVRIRLMDPLGFDGAWLFSPRIHKDGRGQFLEWFRSDELDRPLDLAQANCSVSARGVLRGLHYADVHARSGQVRHLRLRQRPRRRGGPQNRLAHLRPVGRGAAGRRLAAGGVPGRGLGHAFFTLSESATVIYLCSTSYAPRREHGVHPLDPALGIVWPEGIEPILSDKDAAAPTLAEAAEHGLLPSYADCLAHYASAPGPQQGRPGRV